MKNLLLSLRSSLLLLFLLLAASLSSQIVDIESTSDGFLPPRMNTTQRDAITVSPSSDGMIIFNTSTGNLNYFDGIELQWFELHRGQHTNIIDYFRALSNGIQSLLDAGETPLNILNEGASTSEFIGLNYAGGIIFYMESNGTGLVAAPPFWDGVNDPDPTAEWGCAGTNLPGADGTLIGSGNQNTIDIEAGCATLGIAADICANLVLNGFDDWFLSSKNELNEMYTKIGQGANGVNQNIGGFVGSLYFSSTENGSHVVTTQDFNNGTQNDSAGKVNNRYVRAIRAF